MKPVIWSKAARDDLERVWSWIAAHDVAAAERLLETIEDRVRLLQDFSNLGSQTGRDDRKLSLGRYPYVLNYIARDASVSVLGLRHMAQRRD